MPAQNKKCEVGSKKIEGLWAVMDTLHTRFAQQLSPFFALKKREAVNSLLLIESSSGISNVK